ncbi:hypothetical protein CAPTEDRAFT_147683 [Capitella teleta]|uniref:G-protein coupled receptors family 3 profile domain-containing protein n=1 Tax=Capitella teleta TaxID=283909 RepID=R7VM37_CAPTE|nr:hypothetical protein CAPTEDRAFT_147683 [Capitella teleta]|eukprot:ELU18160.1 hypothetical protein CAPTEDRAFT_147683 [Capitella teleta]
MNIRAVIWLLSILSTNQAKLIVPELTPSRYVIPGDLNLGVLHRILIRNNTVYCSTSDGTVHPILLQMCEAAIFAADQINSRTDLLPNITLGLTCVDSCGNSKASLARSLYLMEDHSQCQNSSDGLTNDQRVVGIVGPGFSRVAVAVSNFFSLFKIPVLGTFASADELSNKENFEYFLRMAPPDRFQAQVFVDIILSFNWTYVGLFYSEGNYGAEGAKEIENLVRNSNICLAFTHRLSVESKGEEEEVEQIAQLLDDHRSVSVSIWFTEGPVIIRVLAGLRRAEIAINHIMLLSDSAKTDIAEYPEYIQGGMSIGFPLYEVPGLRNHLASLQPGVNTHNPWIQKAWDTLCEYDNCTLEEIVKSMFDNVQYGMPYYEAVYVYADALHKLITKRCPEAFEEVEYLADCIDGEELLETMKKCELEMISGPIEFDENGDRIGQYHLYHYRSNDGGASVETEFLAVWDQRNFLNFNKKDSNRTMYVPVSLCSQECNSRQYVIQKSPHCCWECRSCRSNERLAENRTTCASCPLFYWPNQLSLEFCETIAHDYLRWSDQLALILLVGSGFGIFVSSVSFGVLYKHKHTRLVKASNIKLSFTMLIGTLFAFLMCLPFVAKPSKITCFFRDVGFNAVFTVLYAPLFVKTCTIYCIFRAGKKGAKTPSFVSNKGQTLMLVVALTIQLGILVAMQSTWPSDTLLRMPVYTEPYVELTCAYTTIPFLMPLTYNILLIFVCGFLGYGCRKLPENFNESGFIFVSASTTIFTWVVFLPTYFTAASFKNQAILLNLCLLLNAFITVGCLFAPKVYALYCVDEDSLKFTPKTVSSIHATKTTIIRVQPVQDG